MTKRASGRALYERFAAFLGVEPAWPEQPEGTDITVRNAWERLAETIEADVQARVAAIIARREG